MQVDERLHDTALNIGRVATLSGVSAKLIRHYESIGLIRKPGRSDSGYRLYNEKDVHTLRFIKRARSLGFSLERIRQLLGLWQNRRRASQDVKRLATAHLQELEQKIAEMQAMATTLKHLIHHCHGDERPDCPILADLAGESPHPPQKGSGSPGL